MRRPRVTHETQRAMPTKPNQHLSDAIRGGGDARVGAVGRSKEEVEAEVKKKRERGEEHLGERRKEKIRLPNEWNSAIHYPSMKRRSGLLSSNGVWYGMVVVVVGW